eukprot:CAMPEP_0115621932 /NCGR_PEP_ID=MMETSP0272-20121206/25986_1 /TAXON_ID=71861 /ORGANISM="Scrippsiella trochoidea, Strain CCMP3099" /LENGTH=111 /DNA_ID=CAMNT_0003058077 /DNA_START=456 /DNA_END=788 /DNA_ORIENTATION=-
MRDTRQLEGGGALFHTETLVRASLLAAIKAIHLVGIPGSTCQDLRVGRLADAARASEAASNELAASETISAPPWAATAAEEFKAKSGRAPWPRASSMAEELDAQVWPASAA